MSTSTNPTETQWWMRQSKGLLARLSKSVEETKEMHLLLEIAFGLDSSSEAEQAEAVRGLADTVKLFMGSIVATCENAAKLREMFPKIAEVAGIKLANVVAAGGLPPPPEPTEPPRPSFAAMLKSFKKGE